MYTYIMY